MDTAIQKERSFVKNKADFSFTLHNTGEVKIQGHPFLSISSRTQIFLDGVIYNRNEDQLLTEIEEKGIQSIGDLEGSFLLFVLTESGFYIVTDKVNSKKAYYAQLEKTWFVSNNIHLLPKSSCTINPEGLACFLANGVMYNTLTLYKEISTTTGGSVYSIINQQLSKTTYWEYGFNYSTPETIESLQKELEQLLIDSIKEMAPAISKASVSLSAGYDIRGILGIIHRYTNSFDISCFSYALTKNKRINSDAYLAQKIAEKCGYTHEVYTSYSGDLVSHIVNNVREGKCIANFCEELETWNALAEKGDCTDVLVGEECFGYFDVPLDTKEKILGLLAVNGTGSIQWIEKFVDKKVYLQLNSSLTIVSDKIWDRLEPFSDPHDKKDFLYFDQRINHVLLPWRENICSKVGFVHNPLLNSKILEFIKKLPPVHRKNKNLYKKTISAMLPDLFAVGFATTSGYTINWQLEIRRNQTNLIEFIQRTDSLLDAIIPKKEIIKMIQHQSSLFSIAMKHITRVVIFFRKKNKVMDTVLTPLTGSRNGPTSRYVYPDFLIIRLLMLRVELQTSSGNSGAEQVKESSQAINEVQR